MSRYHIFIIRSIQNDNCSISASFVLLQVIYRVQAKSKQKLYIGLTVMQHFTSTNLLQIIKQVRLLSHFAQEICDGKCISTKQYQQIYSFKNKQIIHIDIQI